MSSMPSMDRRRSYVVPWLLASFGSVAAVVFCGGHWLLRWLCPIYAMEGASRCEDTGYWGYATLACLAICFGCVHRLTRAGKESSLG